MPGTVRGIEETVLAAVAGFVVTEPGVQPIVRGAVEILPIPESGGKSYPFVRFPLCLPQVDGRPLEWSGDLPDGLRDESRSLPDTSYSTHVKSTRFGELNDDASCAATVPHTDSGSVVEYDVGVWLELPLGKPV